MTTFLRIICCAGLMRSLTWTGRATILFPIAVTPIAPRLIRMPVIGYCFSGARDEFLPAAARPEGCLESARQPEPPAQKPNAARHRPQAATKHPQLLQMDTGNPLSADFINSIG